MEIIIKEYTDKALIIFDKYLHLYLNEYPSRKSGETAKAFLNENYSKFRLDFTLLAFSTLKKHNFNSEIHAEILKKNGLNIVR